MFEGISSVVLNRKNMAPDTDVDLNVGDDESYVKYSVAFAPESGNVSAVATSFIRKPNLEPWQFPWHQECQTHINKWEAR